MKKILSGILYGIFFGFAGVLLVSCVILIINTARRNDTTNYDSLEAITIDDKGETDNTAYAVVDTEIAAQSPQGYPPIELHYGYDMLDSEGKQYLYRMIGENIYSISDKQDNGHYRIARLRVEGERLTEFGIREVVNSYIYDNPQIFWLENLFGYAYAGEDTIVEFYSVLSAEECEDCIRLFNKKVDDIISSVQPNMTEYERERCIHDKLLSGCKYKNGIASSQDGWQYFSPYGAIVTGEAVCEGYAKSMQILLSKVGIPCLTIRGEGEGVSHMWNVVELNNEWYHLDPTWDDNDKDGFIIYEYFNLDSEGISQNHKINIDIKTLLAGQLENNNIDTTARYNFYVPLCTSRDMNYYMQEGVLIEEFDSQTDARVISAIVDKVNDGENYFPVRFGTSMPYKNYIDNLFYQSPYKYYYYIDHANELLESDRQISKTSISVLKNENSSTLRIKINTINN